MSHLTPPELLPLFDLKHDSKQICEGERADIVRFFKPEENDAFVAKTYKSGLTGLQLRENALLFHISQASVKVGGQKVKLNSRIAPLHQATNSTSQGIFEITVRWQGFDLMDWAKLAPRSPQADHKHLMGNAIFLLALARSTLRALYLLHLDGMVHCDIKSDNLCLKWLPGSLQRQKNAYVGQLNPDHLKAIDLGISLKQRSERGPIPDLNGKVPARENHAPRLVAAYMQYLQTRQTQIFEQLDWRVDMWALGHMLQEWAGHDDFLATRSLNRQFFELAEQLKDMEGNFTEGQPYRPAPQPLPHPEIIERMDRLIGAENDQVWEFSVAVSGASGKSQPAVDTVPPPPPPKPIKQVLRPERIRERPFAPVIDSTDKIWPFVLVPPPAPSPALPPSTPNLTSAPNLKQKAPALSKPGSGWFARFEPLLLVSCVILAISSAILLVGVLFGPTLVANSRTLAANLFAASGVLLFGAKSESAPSATPTTASAVAHRPIALIANRYQPQGDGSEVLDTQTGLTWQRFSVGQRWDVATGKVVGEVKKFTFAEAGKLASGGWRLPTVRNLSSLVECSEGMTALSIDLKDGGPKLEAAFCVGKTYQRPTINLKAFPGTADDWYWTSSGSVGVPEHGWGISFNASYVGYGSRSNTYAVKLVR